MKHINIQRLYWLGHVVLMKEDAPAGRVFLMQGSAEVGDKDDLV